jgi:hypothetical protein
LVLVGAIATSGCGDEGSGASTSLVSPTTGAESETDDTVTADGGCPLSADQVSEVLGTEVVKDGCSFFPTDGVVPNASHNPQSSIALMDETRADYGYNESVPGLGDEAYTSRLADGTWVLVHAGDIIFEIRVDMGSEAEELAAARGLAEQVLSG